MPETIPAIAAAWDARDPDWFTNGLAVQRARWLDRHVPPAGNLYRCEFFTENGEPWARCYRYHLNENGQRHLTDDHVPGPHDHEKCEPATERPRNVPIRAFPPEPLLHGHPAQDTR